MDDDLALDGYLSDSSKRVLADAERRASQSNSTKPLKKELGKVKQLTMLPRCIEYLAPRDGAAYLRDSRVHDPIITEGSTQAEWLAFLSGTMGRKPVHPNEPIPDTSSDGNSDDGSSDDNEDDAEPWHIKWHRINPLPKNSPNYK